MRRILRIWPLYFLLVALAFFVFPRIGVMQISPLSNTSVTLPMFLLFLPQLAPSMPAPSRRRPKFRRRGDRRYVVDPRRALWRVGEGDRESQRCRRSREVERRDQFLLLHAHRMHGHRRPLRVGSLSQEARASRISLSPARATEHVRTDRVRPLHQRAQTDLQLRLVRDSVRHPGRQRLDQSPLSPQALLEALRLPRQHLLQHLHVSRSRHPDHARRSRQTAVERPAVHDQPHAHDRPRIGVVSLVRAPLPAPQIAVRDRAQSAGARTVVFVRRVRIDAWNPNPQRSIWKKESNSWKHAIAGWSRWVFSRWRCSWS